uniref:Uncharacterized protein n=1 Tax=Rhizophora mucronata TaxID=61149 RepID=A0A2P2NBP9_RHIMU
MHIRDIINFFGGYMSCQLYLKHHSRTLNLLAEELNSTQDQPCYLNFKSQGIMYPYFVRL